MDFIIKHGDEWTQFKISTNTPKADMSEFVMKAIEV
jgi:hypothetical protein